LIEHAGRPGSSASRRQIERTCRSSPTIRWSIVAMLLTASFRFRREAGGSASAEEQQLAVRLARSPTSGSDAGRRDVGRQVRGPHQPTCMIIAARMLLKSCATLLASCPIPSSFCAWRNCSSRRRSVMSSPCRRCA
jgi:hypothetical protein